MAEKNAKVAKVCKLQFMAGQAKPGPALASAGINMPQFCTAFNDATKDRMGELVPVVITAYEDKNFDFVLKTTPAANLLKKAANIHVSFVSLSLVFVAGTKESRHKSILTDLCRQIFKVWSLD